LVIYFGWYLIIIVSVPPTGSLWKCVFTAVDEFANLVGSFGSNISFENIGYFTGFYWRNELLVQSVFSQLAD
jgi:hypothetical protein